jgi:hypothetical protein
MLLSERVQNKTNSKLWTQKEPATLRATSFPCVWSTRPDSNWRPSRWQRETRPRDNGYLRSRCGSLRHTAASSGVQGVARTENVAMRRQPTPPGGAPLARNWVPSARLGPSLAASTSPRPTTHKKNSKRFRRTGHRRSSDAHACLRRAAVHGAERTIEDQTKERSTRPERLHEWKPRSVS